MKQVIKNNDNNCKKSQKGRRVIKRPITNGNNKKVTKKWIKKIEGSKGNKERVIQKGNKQSHKNTK